MTLQTPTAKRVAYIGVPVLVLLALAYVFTSCQMAAGVTKADRKPLDDVPISYGLQIEEVEFPSRRGDVVLKGWFMPSDSPGAPTIIFVHGIGSTRTGDDTIHIAHRLVAEGYNVLAFDLRAHGLSGGDRISGGYHERWDVLGAIDYLKSRGIPADRIGVKANSMGAGTALLALADEPEIDALVLDSPYASVSELIAQETARRTPFPEWIVPVFTPGAKILAQVLYGINVNAMVPQEAVKKLSYPILVIHGDSDTRIPWAHGERVYKAAATGSIWWLVPGTDHVDAYQNYPDDYIEAIKAYFESRLN